MSGDFKWRHYRGEVILWAVRWYCRCGISYRDLEDMLKERGVDGERPVKATFQPSISPVTLALQRNTMA